MSDVFSTSKRSEIMKKIKGKNTLPERIVRSYLHKRGLRFRLHSRKIPGSPDIVLPKYKSVVFVHGCFWHQHDNSVCTRSNIPKSNQDYWIPKLKRNAERDKENQVKINALGWNVFIIWECQLDEKNLERLYKDIKRKA
jgi:DNA mismatch endonuclease (patch repair protein)